MAVWALGLNHNTAPLDLRGRFAFALDQMAPALHGLRTSHQRHPEAAILGCTHYPLMEKTFQDALGQDVKVYSQANLVAESLGDYLIRRPEMLGKGTQSRFLTTGDPQNVSVHATQFLRRKITFEAA